MMVLDLFFLIFGIRFIRRRSSNTRQALQTEMEELFTPP